MTEIPEAVLQDYQNRTVVSVADLAWADAGQTVLNANVLFAELAEAFGSVPFSTTANADTAHGRDIWAKADAGDYGAIAAFVPPTAAELRANMPPLSARQIRLGLSRAGLLASVAPAIQAMPSPQREEADIEWEFASYFSRTHPLIGQMLTALGLTDTQVDALWEQAASF